MDNGSSAPAALFGSSLESFTEGPFCCAPSTEDVLSWIVKTIGFLVPAYATGCGTTGSIAPTSDPQCPL